MSERSDGVVAHVMWTVFGGMALIALPFVPPIANRTFDLGAAMVAALSILTLAGPAVASTVFRVLRPDAVIWEELASSTNGEKFRVERSMQRRRLYAGIAIAIYAVGVVLAQL